MIRGLAWYETQWIQIRWRQDETLDLSTSCQPIATGILMGWGYQSTRHIRISSHSQLVTSEHTTKPSAAVDECPETVLNTDAVQTRGHAGRAHWKQMTWKKMPDKGEGTRIWWTEKWGRNKLLRKYQSQLMSASATTSSSRPNQCCHLLILRRQSNILWYLPRITM